jgi:thiol-disulfide isomerase/thioredoxin
MRRRLRALVWLVAALPLVGRAAELRPLALETLDGAPLVIEAPSSGVRVLHFWATWCPSCRRELGDLARASAACEGTTVTVLAVNVAESQEEIAAFVGASPSLRIVRDPKGEVWRRSGGRELPANLVRTRDEERWSFGPSDEAAWRDRLAALGCDSARVEP